ncbi:MAG: hypothetical protein NTV73_18665, partial [Hyphomicrobiales bacterium]|nr:hypothetical protein [Hyphomicrobiales bacterium]
MISLAEAPENLPRIPSTPLPTSPIIPPPHTEAAMDGTLAINNTLTALKRILANLVAMAGL